MMDNGFWDDEDEDFVDFLRLYAPLATGFGEEGPFMYEEENEEDWVRVPDENIGRGIENDVISVGEAEGSVLDSDSENEDGFVMIPRKQMSRTHTIEERTMIHKKAEMDENNLLYRFENQTFSDVSGSDSDEEESSVSDEGKKSESRSAENKINQYFCNKLSTNKKSPLIIFMNQLFRPKSENKDGSVVATCTFTDVNNKCCPGSIHVCRKTGVIAEHSDCTHPPRRNHIGVELIIRRMVLMELGGSSARMQHDTAIEMADFYKVSKSLKSNVTTNTYFDSTAMFKSPLWNCRERASQEQEFTNNPSERMFSVYSRLFSHNNYQQLSVAVRRSSDWAESVYKQEQLGFKPKSKAKRCPLYKNKSFKDVVTKDYPTFDDFEKSIHSFMKIPSLGH
ncbi:hypothetical protein CAEBREN_09027 [Caenorhabditis brenneri]|uniref:Uncharacterized protein n=1 Tax=Caenorhabditis brenneri TaxID=135651 RepID=G0MYD4_CAEBE|nr:hypothetical protein CAEBREN_09027 [Caenorhabditis brenneri]